MSFPRRQDERRRRVMLTTVGADTPPATASSRRQMEQLREARRPVVAYGSRVRQCLRGRWFSLVPVTRSATVQVSALIGVLIAIVVGLHHCTVRFPAIADRPELVNVLSMDIPGSLGRFLTGMLMLGLAGTSWLTYQLRRYRNDDFRGHYRVWQMVMVVAMVCSIATMVPLVGLAGALLEWGLGKRVALSGADWIRLLLSVGGAVLAMRTIAEVRRHRAALALLLAGWAVAAIPVAENWNLFEMTTPARWTMVMTSPLIAAGFWFLASVTYLRTLYCEVRGFERPMGAWTRLREATRARWEAGRSETDRQDDRRDDESSEKTARRRKRQQEPAVARTSQSSARSSNSRDTEASNSRDTEDETESPPKRGFRLWGRRNDDTDETTSNVEDEQEPDSEDTDLPDPSSDSETSTKRRWWQRSQKQADDSDTSSNDDAAAGQAEDESENGDEPARKRRWWQRSPGAKEPSTSEQESPTDASQDQANGDDNVETEAPAKRRFGLGLSRRKTNQQPPDEPADDGSGAESAPPSRSTQTQPTATKSSQSDNDELNEEDIDWSSLSKAERRRLRKQLKRSGRAA